MNDRWDDSDIFMMKKRSRKDKKFVSLINSSDEFFSIYFEECYRNSIQYILYYRNVYIILYIIMYILCYRNSIQYILYINIALYIY